jgi:predicted pyridoxine 5'-phosphate oxidase superfamily flavin-nucleotide-binding protein
MDRVQKVMRSQTNREQLAKLGGFMADVSTEQVWEEIENNVFAVLGMVSANQEARTAGIVYVAREGRLYIASNSDTWKVRHVTNNPHVSLTIAIPKSVPLMPWIKVPAATITFAGTATVSPAAQADPAILKLIYRGLEADADALAKASVIVVEPKGEFVTYGIGISLMEMRDTVKARGRAPVRPG